MTTYTGNGVVVSFNSVTLAEIRQVTIDETAQTETDTVAGDTHETRDPVMRDGTGSIDLLDDTAEASFDACVPGTKATMIVYPQGNSGGKPRRTFTAVITRRNRGLGYKSKVPVSVNFEISGAVVDDAV